MIREGERRTPGGMDNDDDGQSQSVILYNTIACMKRGKDARIEGEIDGLEGTGRKGVNGAE